MVSADRLRGFMFMIGCLPSIPFFKSRLSGDFMSECCSLESSVYIFFFVYKSKPIKDHRLYIYFSLLLFAV
jgi:hypothetical protein